MYPFQPALTGSLLRMPQSAAQLWGAVTVTHAERFAPRLQVAAIPGVHVMGLGTICPEAGALCAAMDPWKLAVRVDHLAGAGVLCCTN